jgi:nitrogen fixation protein FixH
MSNINSNTSEPNNSDKKKSGMEWPIGIIIGYLIFVGATLSFVFFTFTVPVNLEKVDYYESTLQYQDQIDRLSRTMALAEPVRFELSSDRAKLNVYFPGEHARSGISGHIHLFRPSDFRLDREVEIAADSLGWQSIHVQGMQYGHWIMKVRWDAGGEEYYWQNELTL